MIKGENTKVPTTFIEHIQMARLEAEKQQIKANAVMINEKLYYSTLYTAGCVRADMMCGLKCFYSDVLPEDTLFAVFEAGKLPDETERRIAELEEENSRLRKTLDEIRGLIRSDNDAE